MPLIDQERLEEAALIIGDSWRGPNKKWYFFLAAVILLAFPIYFAVKITAYNLAAGTYHAPKLLGQASQEPLEIEDKGFIKISDNNYAAFVRLKNANLDWGVPKLTYHSEISDIAGSVITTLDSSTFVLPASEKYILLPRFVSNKAPGQLNFSVTSGKFVIKPPLPEINLEMQRSEVFTRGTETVVTAVIKNTSAFTISRVDLLAFIYNERNEVVGINYTNINDLESSELRSFQLVWPTKLEGRLRVDVTPEINIFEKDILKNQTPISPFDQ